ncbi:hypothetical protein ACFU9B_42010 [Streptomyces sp. NPDC057592]|uniref:hypothetical protein n=1 Tax=unclassified Streptomyces TaxID=2593676 RepID=UPI003690A999
MDGKVPARSVWKGVFSFGMVVLPARLYSATEEHKARLREVHSVDSGRIRHKRVCELEGGGETPVTDQELQLAETLLSELTGIEMRELHDEYGRALEQLVDAKVSGGEVETLSVPQPAADLLAALEESVRAARTSRSGEAD